MKKLFTSTAFLALLLTNVHAQDTLRVQTSAICEMCKETLEYEMTFTKGIKFVELDLENKVLTLAYKENKISKEEIREAISDTGYHADWVPRKKEAYDQLPFCCKDGSHDTPNPQLPTKKPEGKDIN